MSELISLFRKVSHHSAAAPREGEALAVEQATHPEYFVQLLDYLREQRQSQGRALRAAIAALAEGD